MLFTKSLIFLGKPQLSRPDLGLPTKWAIILGWLTAVPGKTPATGEDAWTEPVLKNPEIPTLPSYQKAPSNTFWNYFPSSKRYKRKSNNINIKMLEKFVQRCWFSWTLPERIVAKKALQRLKGAAVKLTHHLPSLFAKNAKSAILNGKWMTDTIATWIKRGYVMGPFAAPPFKLFRVNPLMAAIQPGKIRPILNLSSPKERSFNDSVDPWYIEKLTMSSPKLFGESLIKIGKGAVFSKSDIQDAYKTIPKAKTQRNLYGMKWLGKFFYDKTAVFGSAAAPAWFDPLSALLVNIVCTMQAIPKKYVHRQLDDVPMIGPQDSKLTETFYAAYQNLCSDINIPLATPCPKHEKAFEPSTFGTVLGIHFNSETLTWSVSKAKKNKLLHLIHAFSTSNTCNLKDIQRLIGKLTDFAQMCTFMKGYKFNLLSLLHKFNGNPSLRKLIPANVKSDLAIWRQAIETAFNGLPIPGIIDEPPLSNLTFISDAAGAVISWKNGKRINLTKPNTRGVASIGYNNETIFFAGLIQWPETLLTTAKSFHGKFFGSKSATLEMVGLLIPFLSIPRQLWGRHIILEVDNTAVQFGWQKRYSSADPETSILLRALHVIEAYLHCRIYVKHVKRISTDMALLADNLSRQETFTSEAKAQISHVQLHKPTGNLTHWLENPTMDWNLSLKLLQDIELLL